MRLMAAWRGARWPAWVFAAAVLAACQSRPVTADGSSDVAVVGEALSCPPAAATPAEIASTPRADTNLELLALRLSQRVVAEQGIYDRVVRDLTAIRVLKPSVANISYWPLHDGRDLVFTVDRPTAEALRDQRHRAWRCLDASYVVAATKVTIVEAVPPSAPLQTVSLTLKGIYDTEMLSQLYSSALEKGDIQPNYSVGDAATICVTRNGDRWHYVLSAARGDCPAGCTATTAYYFSSGVGGAVFEEQWDSESGLPAPSWWSQYGVPSGDKAACSRHR